MPLLLLHYFTAWPHTPLAKVACTSIRSSIMQLLIRGRPCTFQSNMSIQFDDGAEITMLRRERPWVMLDTDNHPLFLVTGCETCKEPGRNCRSYTVLTPLLPLGRTPAS